MTKLILYDNITQYKRTKHFIAIEIFPPNLTLPWQGLQRCHFVWFF